LAAVFSRMPLEFANQMPKPTNEPLTADGNGQRDFDAHLMHAFGHSVLHASCSVVAISPRRRPVLSSQDMVPGVHATKEMGRAGFPPMKRFGGTQTPSDRRVPKRPGEPTIPGGPRRFQGATAARNRRTALCQAPMRVILPKGRSGFQQAVRRFRRPLLPPLDRRLAGGVIPPGGRTLRGSGCLSQLGL